jgi:uncharacterized Zn finger protein
VSSRIGNGPWARAFGALLVPDEGAPEAQRGREHWLAGAVEDLAIEPGLITATVGRCAVTVSTPTVPPRIWAAMTSYARGRGPLERAVDGETQSVQLESLMTQDWNEPLVPKPSALVRTCACSDEPCEHLPALGYAVAERIDEDAASLLRWRGCRDHRSASPQEDRAARTGAPPEPWQGSGPLPPMRDARPLRSGVVLRRLGRSGIAAHDADLTDRLLPAYDVFASRNRPADPPSGT